MVCRPKSETGTIPPPNNGLALLDKEYLHQRKWDYSFKSPQTVNEKYLQFQE